MRKSKMPFRLVLAALVLMLGSGHLTEGFAQQRKRPSSGRGRPTRIRTTSASAVADDRDTKDVTDSKNKLEDLNKKIEKNCNLLKEIIITANVSFSQFPYDRNEPADNFLAQCKADGSLTWKAVRKPDDSYTITVDVKASDLVIGGLSYRGGVVSMFSATPKIGISGVAGLTEKQLEWWIDLRHDEYARKFNDNLRELIDNLDQRANLAAAAG